MAKIKTKSNITVKEKKPVNLMEFICGAWLITITAIMPFFLSDAYARVLQDKYGMLLVASGILVVCFIIWALFDHRAKHYFEKAKSYANPETGKWFWNWCKKTFNLMDICVLTFTVSIIISTLLSSPYTYQCFFGNEGRYCGVLFFLVLIIDYFIVSRNLRYKNIYITVFLVSAIIISVWAVTDYFNLDWIKFKWALDSREWTMFISTIGNLNSYAGYAMIPLAISAVLFVCDGEGKGRKTFYAMSFFFVVLSMITANSDNGYLAIFTLYMSLPFVALTNRGMIRRYIVLLAIVFTALEIVTVWNNSFSDMVMHIDGGLFGAIGNILPLLLIAIILWSIVIVIYVVEYKRKDETKVDTLPKCLKATWTIIVCAVAVAIIAVVAIANTTVSALPDFLKPFESYLVFSDSWGIWRAYVWKILLKMYAEMPFINQLFGRGLETVQIYLFNSNYYDVAATTLQIFDSPHNELLQMLLSVGAFGLIVYVGLLLSPIISVNKCKDNKYYSIILAVGIMLLCHIFECAVTIMTPIDTPVWFAFLMVACNLYRNKETDI